MKSNIFIAAFVNREVNENLKFATQFAPCASDSQPGMPVSLLRIIFCMICSQRCWYPSPNIAKQAPKDAAERKRRLGSFKILLQKCRRGRKHGWKLNALKKSKNCTQLLYTIYMLISVNPSHRILPFLRYVNPLLLGTSSSYHNKRHRRSGSLPQICR